MAGARPPNRLLLAQRAFRAGTTIVQELQLHRVAVRGEEQRLQARWTNSASGRRPRRGSTHVRVQPWIRSSGAAGYPKLQDTTVWGLRYKLRALTGSGWPPRRRGRLDAEVRGQQQRECNRIAAPAGGEPACTVDL
jgi:hypothetical protein